MAYPQKLHSGELRPLTLTHREKYFYRKLAYSQHEKADTSKGYRIKFSENVSYFKLNAHLILWEHRNLYRKYVSTLVRTRSSDFALEPLARCCNNMRRWHGAKRHARQYRALADTQGESQRCDEKRQQRRYSELSTFVSTKLT